MTTSMDGIEDLPQNEEAQVKQSSIVRFYLLNFPASRLR